MCSHRGSQGLWGADRTSCLGLPGWGRKPRPKSARLSQICCPCTRGPVAAVLPPRSDPHLRGPPRVPLGRGVPSHSGAGAGRGGQGRTRWDEGRGGGHGLHSRASGARLPCGILLTALLHCSEFPSGPLGPPFTRQKPRGSDPQINTHWRARGKHTEATLISARAGFASPKTGCVDEPAPTALGAPRFFWALTWWGPSAPLGQSRRGTSGHSHVHRCGAGVSSHSAPPPQAARPSGLRRGRWTPRPAGGTCSGRPTAGWRQRSAEGQRGQHWAPAPGTRDLRTPRPPRPHRPPGSGAGWRGTSCQRKTMRPPKATSSQ